jgi:predicted transposase/invertase (TIGR01784 family)
LSHSPRLSLPKYIQGRQEEKQEMVQRLQTMGLTLEQIAQAVDLPIETITQMLQSQP